jgi:type III secretion system FlhB-like substrate exporter
MVTAESVGAEGKAKIEKEIVTKAKKSQPLLALEKQN